MQKRLVLTVNCTICPAEAIASLLMGQAEGGGEVDLVINGQVSTVRFVPVEESPAA